jgi:sulfur relay (sulfurtransferase) complex TusBCD TusD component (DsrE family)
MPRGRMNMATISTAKLTICCACFEDRGVSKGRVLFNVAQGAIAGIGNTQLP